MTLSQGNHKNPHLSPSFFTLYVRNGIQKRSNQDKHIREVSLLALGGSLRDTKQNKFPPSIVKPQMQQLKEPFEKTKKFFQKSLRDLKKVLLIGDYRRLTKSASCNPFSFGRTKTKNGRGDCYYTDFCDDWQCDLDMATKRKNMSCNLGPPRDQCREEIASNGSSMRLGSTSPIRKKGGEGKEKKAKRISSSRKGEDQLGNAEGGYPLARKMKELEMIDGSDVEHVLDVEEAIHYYSRLRSPVYLDLVDKFFTDMYTEFATPPASASITSSKRKLSSLRL